MFFCTKIARLPHKLKRDSPALIKCYIFTRIAYHKIQNVAGSF